MFNSGDGADLITTTTDETGRFKLHGFKAGSVYVFAEKPDYRFTGMQTSSGATGVVVKLLSKDESPPPWHPQQEPMPLDQQRQIAPQNLGANLDGKQFR